MANLGTTARNMTEGKTDKQTNGWTDNFKIYMRRGSQKRKKNEKKVPLKNGFPKINIDGNMFVFFNMLSEKNKTRVSYILWQGHY